MPLPPLNSYRHDRRTRALITLAGEIGLETMPLMRTTLERCLRDGVRTIDIDLTGSGFLLQGPSTVPGPVSRPAALFATAPVPLAVAGFDTSRRVVPAVPAVPGGVA
ncbi:hypothetical protein DEJ48_09265 [Streptomyces venezuelae]|uniref:STAS domain-containing protein n=1 Tax=Streptomyces venezuelae TaxID=54571 RepID=A0A5P2BST8_STRVZ|nr:hypothetical protein [Streptomyces venezuelae]QES33555.1 hypothetical protein DEJ48_09265 [Streptomyces venezuelae]